MAAMVKSHLPHRIIELDYQRRFPVLYENIVLVVDAPTPEEAGTASAQLAERLNESPEYFHNVFMPGGEFFEKHGLLYMDTDELEDFADRMARFQPYLAGLAQDGTLRGLAMMLERGVAAVRSGDIGGEELVPMVGRVTEAIAAERAGEPYKLSWAEVVAGSEMEGVSRRRFILAQPALDFTKILSAEAPIEAVRRFARELNLDEEHGFSVRVTGDVALAYDDMKLIQFQTMFAGAVSFFLVSGILAYAFRSLRMVVATATTLIVGLIDTAAFAVWAVGHLNMISVAFAVLFIGLSVDFGIHLVLRYREAAGQGHTHGESLAMAGEEVGTSILLCAITTSIGFYAFVPTDFGGVAELGLISGTGVFISVLLNLTCLPAFLSLGIAPGDKFDFATRARAAQEIVPFQIRHPRTVGIGAVVFAAGAIWFLPQIEFDGNPLRVRDPSTESVRVFEELLADGQSSPWDISVLAPDRASAEVMAKRLLEVPEVGEAITVDDYVPADQEDKIAILEDVSMFLGPPLAAGEKKPAPTFEEQLAALEGLDEELERLSRDGDEPELAAAGSELREQLAGVFEDAQRDRQKATVSVDAIEDILLGTLPRQLDGLQNALSAESVTIEDLPRELLERMVSADGTVRINVSPAEDLNDDKKMAEFVAAVREVAPDATGGAVGVFEASSAVVRAFRQALTAAVVVIALILFIIWQTIGDTLLVMAPLALAAVLTGAIAVIFGIPFNFADVIALPLILGIGVDTGIHLVERWRLEGTPPSHLLETSTARGVVFSALTTMGSFGTLGFTTHLGISSMGKLLAIGVALTVICNLFVLPALIELRDRRIRPGKAATI
jgi:hopanoid biosynthesis associated RND transporter like protein HpnN